MAVKPKVLRYAAALDERGRASAEGGDDFAIPGGWEAEHLVLAGLARCSLTSLRHFARQRGSAADGSAKVNGAITRRDDGSWGFVEIAIELDVTIEPEPDDVPELLAKAEWGCFVGASLRPKPQYRWRVNGRDA